MRAAGRVAALGLLSLLLGAGCGAEGESGGEGGGEALARTVGWEPVAPVDTAVVLGAWPHDRAAFTQGFALDGGTLVESTGRHGESSIRRVRPETGEVIARADLDRELFGEGAAVLGDRVFQVTWTSGVGYVYDRETLAPLDTVRYDGDAWGLATDGASLILSDGTPRLRFLDPETFRTTRTVTVRDGDAEVWELNELEWVRGEVWANVWKTDRIARIDPRTGRVLRWVNLSGLLDDLPIVEQEAVANGIAYDEAGDRLLLTGKLWPNVFRVRVGEIGSGDAETAPPAAP